MKPLRLTMQAFGPYAMREVVDFTDAMRSGLFGIYGPTGAGKSSIFSGISFALFGEAAKDEQAVASLRSDHSAADMLTEVELVFEVGQRRFCVRRQPEQMRPAQRGGGETKHGHTASLFEATGVALDAITQDNPGKVIAEKKVGEVGAYVQDLLGYGAAQFRQIVLLPQGRFEKFLLARTDERLAILRELFDVSLYRNLALHLKEKARDEKAAITRLLDVHRDVISREGCSTLDELADATQAADAKAQVCESEAKEAEQAAQACAQALVEARQADKDFVELDAAKSAQADLSAKAPAFEVMKRLMDEAALAQGLADVDAAVAECLARVSKAEQNKASAAAKQQAANDAHQTATVALVTQQGRADERKALEARDGQLRQWQEALAGAVGLASARDTSAAAHSAAVSAYNSAHILFEQARAKRDMCANGVTQARDINARITACTARGAALTTERDQARSHNAAQRALDEAQGIRARDQSSCEAAEERHGHAASAYEEAEQRLSAAQAVHLAEKLANGDPCPVCGSTEHPSPAQGDASSQNLDQRFRTAKATLGAARTELAAAQNALAASLATVTERSNSFAALAAPTRPLAEIEADLQSVRTGLEKFGGPRDEAAAVNAFHLAEEALATAQNDAEAKRSAQEKASIENAAAAARYDAAIQHVPENLRNTTALGDAITLNERTLAALIAALDKAIAAERSAAEMLAAQDAELRGVEAALGAAQQQHAAATSTFNDRLDAVGLTPERYTALKAEIARIPEQRDALDTFNQDSIGAASRVALAEARIAELARPDIVALDARHAETSSRREQAHGAASTARVQATRLAALIVQLKAEREAITAREAAYGPLGAVAEALNGSNAAKTDIEAFAITAMFDRVLDAANLRLKPMSAGRYTLQREQESRGNAKRGLGLAAFDIHTGRPRAISTLSGGETFQAALSLALGLSDVVESLSGGIRLDTIFIDEGFGSLDTETLDQALQTLQDLVGQSRTVGLISHIDLVQQVIPNGFSIEKSVNGSTIKKRAA
jgi:exonuclease SbcC